MEGVEEKVQNQPTKRRKTSEEEDRISALPDCLLIEILSRLPYTKYAIRTGTLSKRWQHLWPYVHNLIFQSPYPIRSTQDDRHTDFFMSIDQTLTQCRQSKLNKFELGYSHVYKSKFDSQVNNWIRYAVNCNVEYLNLVLLNDALEPEFVVDDFVFINARFTHLKLEGCIFNPTGAISWDRLESLYLSHMELDEDLIENMLSGCPVLETFELRYCYGYECLNITSKSVKNLIFSGYSGPDEGGLDDLDDIIGINAPDILSLKICGDLLLWRLFLLDVSSLVKAELNYEKRGHHETTRKETEQEMLKGFILRLPHVNELKIGIFCFKAFFFLEATGFNFPSNLKVLDSLEIADWFDWSDSDSDSDNDSVDNGDWKVMRLND